MIHFEVNIWLWNDHTYIR